MSNSTNIDERFYLRPGEKPDQYLRRTRSYFGGDSTIGNLYRPPRENRDYEEGLRYYRGASRPVDERRIRSNILGQFQKEIDAYNQVYAQKLAEVKQQGIGRLGSSRASQARSGLLGSDFGSAQTDKVVGANNEIENLVRSELAAKIGEIEGRANAAASVDIAAKRAAQEQGVEKYLEYLGKKSETIKSNVNALALDLYNKGISPDQISGSIKKIAKQYGVTEEDIRAAYDETKINQDEAKKAKKEDFVSIGDGAQLYNVKTGEIIENKKGSAGGGGGGVGSGNYIVGVNPEVDAWVENIKAGRAKFSDIPASQASLRTQVSSGLAKRSKDEVSDSYKAASDLLDMNTDAIAGLPNVKTFIRGTDAQLTLSKAKQLGALISLDNRQKLKGSGAISDFEAKILGDSGSALDINPATGLSKLKDTAFKKELRKIKAALGLASNIPAMVTITDPTTGQSKTAEANREQINEAYRQGYGVEFYFADEPVDLSQYGMTNYGF